MVCYASEVHNLLFESTVVQEGKFFFCSMLTLNILLRCSCFFKLWKVGHLS